MKPTLGIAGARGRMGQALLAAAAEQGLGTCKDTREAATLCAQSDAIIDFTAPDYTVELAAAAASAKKPLVIGTTGLSAAQQQRIIAASAHIPIVQSANFSIGVTVLSALVEQAAALLDDAYDIDIDEMHHRLKKDAPSGTALLLAQTAAKGRAVDSGYVTHTGGERPRGAIGMSVKRGGEVVGTHTVTFAGPGENLELTHRAHSRAIFAHGAIKAALWALQQKPGLYGMREVLFRA